MSAQTDFDELEDAWRGHKLTSMQIGYIGFQMKREGKFAELGLTEAECRDRIGVSQRVWGRMVRIAEALSQLTKQEFLSLTADNAEQLAKLPEENRYDPELLTQAAISSSAGLKRTILHWRSERDGIPVPDLRTSVKISLFEAQKEVVLAGLRDFQRQHGLVEMGTALEWAVIEVVWRKTLVEVLQQAVPRLRRALKADNLDAMRTALEEHVLALARALEELRVKRGQ